MEFLRNYVSLLLFVRAIAIYVVITTSRTPAQFTHSGSWNPAGSTFLLATVWLLVLFGLAP